MRDSLRFFCALAWVMAPATSATGEPPGRPGPSAAGEIRIVDGIFSTTEFAEQEADGTNGVNADPVRPFAALPVLSEALQREIDEVLADELLRVIIMLRHLPQDRISAEVQARYAAERTAIDDEADAILQDAAARRDPTLPKDADNHPELIRSLPQEREALRSLNLRREALDKAIIGEMTGEIAAELAPFIARVRSAIEDLGGEFEFSTTAGSLVVARVPAGRIAELAKHPDVLRMTEDGLLHSALDIMDDATLVSAPGGLWASGFDGGTFDPAIIDTGLDIYHPGMANGTSPARSNFYTWFLTAAAAHPDFGDVTSQDDVEGHGTHVAGIVGCYGSAGYEDRVGMARGVEKLVTLKAGWLNSSAGRGMMYASDMYGVVDRGLNHTDDLFPQGTFGDDVDGMNLSFGADTTDDETDGSRFWDSVVSSYPDLPVTLSAGNAGAGSLRLVNFALAYNGITVANVQVLSTPERDNDQIDFTSSSGPTASGRRKPDLAAPGGARAPNNDWETENDYVWKSGTSMAAPSVLGVIMDLMDAGVTDELALKALLINTAQKNEPGIDIEADPDGWDERAGFGYMNALAAFGHRSDVFLGVLEPRGDPDDYRLYKGLMRDEGPAGEGRDRATMVWNRHATYDPAAPPTTYYTLVDLNLQLYHEADETLVDFDVTPLDNVQQVRIESGAAETPVVVKAYAWSTSYPFPGRSEPFALATEEGFTEVALPASFTGEGSWPSSVEPDESFIVGLRVRNASEIASHDNTFDLDLPPDWSLTLGDEIQNVGSAPGSNGTSAYAVWEIRAPALSPPGPAIIPVDFTHHSYNEPWGTLTFELGVTVEWDTGPPRPDPMFFTIAPAPAGLDEIGMQAVEATDLHEPVEYLHEYRTSPTGGGGGTSSGWQRDRDYSDTGLAANHQYCYRVLARDAATVPNSTAPSADHCAFTLIEAPPAPIPTVTGPTQIEVQTQGTYSNLGEGSSGVRVDNLTSGTDSGWMQVQETWTSADLAPNTLYEFAVRSRNGDGVENPIGPSASAVTHVFPPAQAEFGSLTHESVTARWSANGNPDGTEYLVANLSTGNDSGWTTVLEWLDDSTGPSGSYSYQATARNAVGVETAAVSLGTVWTPFFGDGFESGTTAAWSSTSP